jgi:hypothetical protein
LLPPGSKVPKLGSNGFHDATDDLKSLKNQARQMPSANLAIRTGEVSGVVVLDFDRHEGIDGFATKRRLEGTFGPLPETVTISTPGNGEHHYFTCRSRIPSWSGQLGGGFDVRGESGYAVLPPSVVDGKKYGVQRNVKIAELPKRWAAALAQARKGKTTSGNYSPLPQPARPPQAQPKTLDEIASLELTPIRWAIKGLIPEGVTLLVGAPKLGKSFLMLQAGLAVARGQPFFGKKVPKKKGAVLYVSYEDNDRRVQKRVRQLVADGRFPKNFHMAYEWLRMNEGGIEALDQWLSSHPKTRLVVIDTLAQFRSAASAARTAYDFDYEVGRALVPLALKRRVAFVLVHHTAKGRRSDVLEAVNSTNGLPGGVDTIMVLARERHCPDGALYVTGKDIEKEGYWQVHRQPNGGWRIGGPVEDAQRSDERKDITRILDQEGPCAPHELARLLGKSPEATRQLLMKMIASGEVSKEGKKYKV